jgi:hypothetical protein
MAAKSSERPGGLLCPDGATGAGATESGDPFGLLPVSSILTWGGSKLGGEVICNVAVKGDVETRAIRSTADDV